MALSIFAGLGVDIGVVGGIIFIVFFTLFIISRLLCLIKKYRINCKVKRQVLPRRNVNTRARTTVATHLSQAIVPEPREPPKTTNAATGASISASTYHESERVEKCVSCVCPLQKGDMVLRLPACDHLLHDFCIGPWFFVNSICPGCGEKVNGQFTVRVGRGGTV
ncbi:RING-H2 finger protein ATL71 [Carex littledalei]|uniref:RING-type E3 ubiquitin transferase n=1 Tax=Carex littledalei TaxID=544730 RepID=A0A833QG02_9POAL|nr:RING-H2 finger protein ATL71 [Carex littledalei]